MIERILSDTEIDRHRNRETARLASSGLLVDLAMGIPRAHAEVRQHPETLFFDSPFINGYMGLVYEGILNRPVLRDGKYRFYRVRAAA